MRYRLAARVVLTMLLAQPALPQYKIFQSLHQHAVSRPPARLFIDDEVFQVGMLEAEHMAGDDGVTICSKHLILINVDESDLEMKRTFMHEVLHAITCKYGGSAKLFNSRSEKKHEGVEFLAPKLTGILMINPRLLSWLDGGGLDDVEHTDQK